MTKEEQQRIYRVNVFCPNCKEEHIYYDLLISEEEQRVLNNYYMTHQGESSLALLLKGAPLIIERGFKCPICEAEFHQNVGSYKDDRLGFKSDDCIQLGQSSITLE